MRMTDMEQAAEAIIALINSSPQTPTKEEIAAVLLRGPVPPPSPGSNPPLTIDGAAQAIIDAQELRNLAERANYQERNEPAAKPPIMHFEDYQEAADHCQRTMQDAILGLEPRDRDEALTLLLVVADAFASFASNHSDANENDKTEAERGVLERAIRALMRWFANSGATSRLLGTYAVASWLMPLPEQLRIVREYAEKSCSDAVLAFAVPSEGGSRHE